MRNSPLPYQSRVLVHAVEWVVLQVPIHTSRLRQVDATSRTPVGAGLKRVSVEEVSDIKVEVSVKIGITDDKVEIGVRIGIANCEVDSVLVGEGGCAEDQHGSAGS